MRLIDRDTMRLIDANALIEALLDARREQTETTLKLIRFVEKRPTAEPKRGRWIYTEYENGNAEMCCSECGEGVYNKTCYCPNCGADMRGEIE